MSRDISGPLCVRVSLAVLLRGYAAKINEVGVFAVGTQIDLISGIGGLYPRTPMF